MPASEVLYTIEPSADSTIALEVWKTGLMSKRKHLIFFENFSGALSYAAEEPQSAKANLVIDTGSAVCRDNWLKPRKQHEVTKYVKEEALVSDGHREIQFRSSRISPKPLRGFVVEGELKICGISRLVKVNVVLNEKKHDVIQLDGDATLHLSDFDIKVPSSLFGLIGTKDEALVRILLWARPQSSQLPAFVAEV